MKYAYCRKNYRICDFCIGIPVTLVHTEPFRNLSVDACSLYSYLLYDQMLSKRVDKKGYGFVTCTKTGLATVLRCSRKKAERVLSELSDKGAGLLAVSAVDPESLIIHVKDYARPILPPNAKKKRGYY